MRERAALFYLIFMLVLGGVLWLGFREKSPGSLEKMIEQEPKSLQIREPAVAGQFYPAEREELEQQIRDFLKMAELPAAKGNIRALISPHAGYVFSGPVAAYCYKSIQGKNFDTIIIIGPSHHSYIENAIIDGNDIWKTPLGEVMVDKKLRNSILKENDLFEINSQIHSLEHCLEVQIPFLQVALGNVILSHSEESGGKSTDSSEPKFPQDNNFKILPILVNKLTDQELEKISDILAKYIDDKTLIIASSDMSHYPSYEDANYSDKKVLKAILTGKVEELRNVINNLEKENIPNLHTCLCGETAVEVVMKVAEKINAEEIELLKYANSGDTSFGDKSQVVGYGAVAFMSDKRSVISDKELNEAQKKKLLEIAKTSVEKYILENKIPEFKIDDPVLNTPMGAFVTIRKHGQLRGCIGRFWSKDLDLPLYKTVSYMAIAAATSDTRFLPVRPEELKDLTYEISVLSPLKKIDDWHKIEIGKHGVEIRKGNNVGVFLPQVATENNWDLEEFMGNLCEHKAGLPRDAWKTGEVELYIFTAQVFGEE